MPAALKVDWAGIRAAAIALNNVSQAALQAASALPQEEQQRFREAVSKRASRENWLGKAQQVVATASQAPQIVSGVLSKPVQSGADALANTLAERHGRTKLGLSAWSAKSAEHLATLDGEEALAAHQAAAGTAQVMTKLWPEQAAPSVRISMFGQAPVIDIEATVVEREELSVPPANTGSE